jgi:hypothetical protein
MILGLGLELEGASRINSPVVETRTSKWKETPLDTLAIERRTSPPVRD